MTMKYTFFFILFTALLWPPMFLPAQSADPAFCPELLTKARAAVQDKNWNKARDYCETALPLCPAAAAEVRTLLNQVEQGILSQRDEADIAKKDAQETLKKLQEANKKFVQGFLQDARNSMAKERYDEAYDKIQVAGGLNVLGREVGRAYLDNADSCLLDPDSIKYEIAKKSIEAAAALKGAFLEDIGNSYLRIFESAIQNGQSGLALDIVNIIDENKLPIREKISKLHDQVAENAILNLKYDAALKSAQAAETLKVIHPDTIKNLYLEVAFWHAESRNIQRAAGILDTLTARPEYAAARKRLQNLPIDSAEAVGRLREVLQTLDAGQYERLQRRYYPVMVTIPGGKFMMGCDKAKDPDCEDDETPHEQEIRNFEMASTETTVWQFGLFCAATGREIDRYIEWSNSGDNPVVNVSWFDAAAYASWVSRQKGLPEAYENKEEEWAWTPNSSFRLPTEAEWEFAAGSGPRHTKYSWGDGPPSGRKGGNVADETAKRNFSDWTIFEGYADGYVYTAPVGSFEPNDFGLFDMSGNVWEWCWDWYGDYLTDQKTDYKGPDTGSSRVNRGGSWDHNPRYCRVSNRDSDSPDDRYNSLGFRLARTP